MLIATSIFTIVFAFAAPIALALALRRAGARLGLFAWGAAAFIGSQVVHIPMLLAMTAAFENGVIPRPPPSWIWLNPLILGLAAGICEEPARWLVFRFALRREEDRSPRAALMVGAGHGGVEAMLLVGLAGALSLAMMLIMRSMSTEDLAQLGVDAASAEALVDQVRTFWASGWWTPLLAAWERVSAITFHVALTALVAFGIRRRSAWPLPLAITLHAALDFVAVLGTEQHWNTTLLELVLFAMVVPFAAIVLALTWRDQTASSGGASS